jgi:3-oxoacyl-[acyl-carrier protein] reductase
MRRALITGVGHRQGIGYATATRLAARGDRVFTTRWDGYDADRAFNQDDEIPWPSLNANLEALDASAQIFEAAEAEIGKVDILVLNHAYSQRDELTNFEPDVLDLHLAVNVRGSLLLCQEFVKRNESGWGSIVFLTSGQSLHPMPEEISYAASKGAVEAVSLALAGGLASRGITVNAVDPGATDTGWISPNEVAQWSAESPRGRVGQSEDAARLIDFLTSDGAHWVTGQLIRSRGFA